jgi:alginate O-acetyltransferase complex protein AlgI
MFLLKYLEKAPAAVGHLYTMILVILNWVIFANTDILKGFRYIGMMFGSTGQLANSTALYYLRDNIVLLLVCAIASTPIANSRWNFLRSEKGKLLIPALTVIGLVICTAFIVDASYNPFLYFRF